MLRYQECGTYQIRTVLCEFCWLFQGGSDPEQSNVGPVSDVSLARVDAISDDEHGWHELLSICRKLTVPRWIPVHGL